MRSACLLHIFAHWCCRATDRVQRYSCSHISAWRYKLYARFWSLFTAIYSLLAPHSRDRDRSHFYSLALSLWRFSIRQLYAPAPRLDQENLFENWLLMSLRNLYSISFNNLLFSSSKDLEIQRFPSWFSTSSCHWIHSPSPVPHHW